MNGYAFLRICTVLVIFFSISQTSSAQIQFDRVSKAERSDGLGYVVRFHFEQPIDSFEVIQPAFDLIQMQLFGYNIDTTGIQLPEIGGKIQEVRLYEMEDSFGVDIYLDQNVYVMANAYPDKMSDDILLALTKSTAYEVEVYTQQFLAKNWYLNINPEDALDITMIPAAEPDENYNDIADKLKFDTIVIDAGHGGKDPGNIGYRRTKEKDIVLAISKKLGEYIEEYLPDVNVIYTRDDDTFIDLYDRGSIANQHEGDLLYPFTLMDFTIHQYVEQRYSF